MTRIAPRLLSSSTVSGLAAFEREVGHERDPSLRAESECRRRCAPGCRRRLAWRDRRRGSPRRASRSEASPGRSPPALPGGPPRRPRRVFLDVLIVGVDRGDARARPPPRSGRCAGTGPPARPAGSIGSATRSAERVRPRSAPGAAADRLGCDGPAGQADGRFVQPGDQLAAQLVEQAHRHHRPALDRRLQAAELIDRASQAAELGPEELDVGGPGFGRRQRHDPIRTVARGADRGPCRDRSGSPATATTPGRDPPCARRSFKRAAQPAGQLGIVGLPDSLADLELVSGRYRLARTAARRGPTRAGPDRWIRAVSRSPASRG